MTQREIMEVLHRGEKVINIETNLVVHMEDGGQLFGNDTPLTMIPFNAENQDDWTFYVDESNDPKYYQWISVSDDESTVTITRSFYCEDVPMAPGFAKYGDGYTLENLLVGRHN